MTEINRGSKGRRAGRPPRRFVRQAVWVTGGRVAGAVLQAALLVVAARAMQPSQFGHLGALLGIVTLAQTAVDLGVGTFIIRQRALRDNGPVATAIKFVGVTSTLLAAGLALGIALVGFFIDADYFMMLPLAIWAAAERNADTRLSVAFADGDVHLNVVNLIGRRSAALLLLLVALGIGLDPVLAFSVGSAIAALASAWFARRATKHRLVVGRSISFRELVRRSRSYWVHSVAVQARNLDVMIVGAVSGAAQAGFYSSGSRLTSPLRLLPTSIASLLLPHAARRSSSLTGFRAILRGSALLVGGMTVLYAGLLVATPVLINVALGSAYAGAAPAIQVVLIGLPFTAGVSLLTSILQGAGRGAEVARTSVVTMCVCLLGVMAGAWYGGALGGAVGLSFAYVVQFSIQVALTVGVYRELKATEVLRSQERATA